MFAALADKTGELMLCATRRELRDLAEVLASGRGRFELDTNVDVTPYDIALSHLTIETVDRPTTRITSDRTSRQLTICGTTASLVVLAENVREFAAASDADGHLHIEYFPDHFYLDESSMPLVVEYAK